MPKVIENVFVSGYDSDVSYEKYDVVKIDGSPYPLYFVSASGDNLGTLDTENNLSNSGWKRFDDVDWNFSEIWTPSYQTSLTIELKPRLSPYGDGYAQKVDNSIFFNRMNYSISFDAIDNRELTSLISFFEYKGGQDFFKIDITTFATGRKYVAKSWQHAYIAENISSLTANLSEFISDLNV
jgi:phage-related protein